MSTLDEVYELIARRDVAKRLPAYELAKSALSKASGNELLALHEAIVESTSSLLMELGEHGLSNFAVYDRSEFDPAKIDVPKWAADSLQSWLEVKRLRAEGADSSALIAKYVGNWMVPIGGQEWLSHMRNGVPYRADPDNVAELVQLLAEEAPQE